MFKTVLGTISGGCLGLVVVSFFVFVISWVLYAIPNVAFGYNQRANWRGTRVVQWRGLQNLRFAGSNPARASKKTVVHHN